MLFLVMGVEEGGVFKEERKWRYGKCASVGGGKNEGFKDSRAFVVAWRDAGVGWGEREEKGEAELFGE